MKKFGKTAAAEARREEMKENKKALAGIGQSAWACTKAWTHNGAIGILYGIVMFLVFYLALQIAFYGVAMLSGSTGAYAMETPADVLTVYVILGMVCGFCLFFSFKIENMLVKAMKDRFWHVEGAEIDKGAAWHRRHKDD